VFLDLSTPRPEAPYPDVFARVVELFAKPPLARCTIVVDYTAVGAHRGRGTSAHEGERGAEAGDGNGGADGLVRRPGRVAGVDLTVLEGVDESTDVGRFPTVKHFTSWLGLCPQHQGSAGKIRSRGTRRGANRVGRALRLAVRSCHHAKNALGAFYRRIQARAGAPKAIVATARKLAERVYRLLRYGEDYVRQDAEAYEAAYRARVVKGLARRAGELGYRLEPAVPEGA
jgi:hypothetical protein